jgi:hypothetical protein
MSIDASVASGRLTRHPPSAGDVASFLAEADAALATADAAGLAPAERFRHTGRAALAAAKAALAAAGFRGVPQDDEPVIDSLAETVGAGPALVGRLRTLLGTRSSGGGPGVPVSAVDAELMHLTADALRIDVEKWIRSRRPELLAPKPEDGEPQMNTDVHR